MKRDSREVSPFIFLQPAPNRALFLFLFSSPPLLTSLISFITLFFLTPSLSLNTSSSKTLSRLAVQSSIFFFCGDRGGLRNSVLGTKPGLGKVGRLN